MIYQTGTIKTTAGQTKITGTGTRWKDNLNGISEGCPISYLINNVVYMNTVLSVNSDTEINLTYPVPVAASAAKYQIATFVLDSMSDGVRKMLANQQYIQYFLRNMDTWMTQDGIVEVKTPTGETVKLESIIALKKLIDGKLSTSGGVINGGLQVKNEAGAHIRLISSADNSNYIAFHRNGSESNNDRIAYIGFGEGNTKQFRISNDKIGKSLVFDESGLSITGRGEVVHIGDFGIGKNTGVTLPTGDFVISSYRINGPAYCYGGATSDSYNKGNHNLFNIFGHSSGNYGAQLGFAIGGKSDFGFRVINNNAVLDWCTIYHTGNTTKDSNGNLKAASPIIKVFSDHIELNDESEGVELEKLGTGRYKLKGTLGMNSDASWGGYNGGLVAPLGINGLELLWVDYKVLPDGDIIIETNYRKHSDLPPPVLLKRLITYPEFMDENGDELESYAPVDIPNGHWIDVRVNMPSDSIYNQKLAEAERLAKIEAERVAKEEAEKSEREAILNISF
ncbi:TPA: hypothetical protein QH450_002058 [Providencia alcalifaciens]|nr:hypothetical protein [Providencia alcalifaciens]